MESAMKSFSTTLEAFYHWEQTRADAVFLRARENDSWHEYSWAEVGGQVRRCASLLQSLLPEPGQRVAILAKNSPHWFIVDLAAQIAGHVVVPLFTTMTEENIDYALKFSEVQLLFLGAAENWQLVAHVVSPKIMIVTLPGTTCEHIAHSTWEDAVASQNPLQGEPIPPTDELRTLILTSGTTGLPKGVMYSLGTIREMGYNVVRSTGTPDHASFISYLPLAHAAERIVIEGQALLVGGVVTFNESLATFSDDMKKATPHWFFSVPRIWTKLKQGILAKLPQDKLNELLADSTTADTTRRKIAESLGLQNAVYIACSTAPMTDADHHWFESIGLPLCEMYGQTELIPMTVNTPQNRKQGSLGQAIDGVEVKIADNGEILGRGKGIMMGYYRDPQKTAETLKDGWLHSGDKGRLDEDGYLFLTGRVKEIFKGTKGKYVAPAPIENLFNDHPLIEQQCLVGSGMPFTIMATVINQDAADGMTDNDIEEQLRAHTVTLNTKLEHHAQIGALLLTREHWSIENGMLTHTLKVKRDAVEDMYAALFEEIIDKTGPEITIVCA
jgi:long-chain acyl-CoA synthetase